MNIVLVGGSGRSGTTILNKILGQHSSCFVTPPWRFMTDPDGVFDFISNRNAFWTPYHDDIRFKRLQKLLKEVARPNLFGTALDKLNLRKKTYKLPVNILPKYAHINAEKHCLEFEQFSKQLLHDIKAFDYQAHWVGSNFLETRNMSYIKPDAQLWEAANSFYLNIVQSCLKHSDKENFIDRNTWNHLAFDSFYHMNPKIKLLHIYRHPKDVICSFVKQNWMPKTYKEAAYIYQDLMDQWFRVRTLVPENSYMEVSLENLVSNPPEALKDVCNFIGVDFEERMLEVSLEKSNSGKWKSEIPKSDRAAIDRIISETLQIYNYE